MRLNYLRSIITVLATGAALLAALAGCNGKDYVATAKVSFPLNAGITLGPSSGLPVGVPAIEQTLPPFEVCGLPTPEEIRLAVEAQVGDVFGGILELDSVELDQVVFAAAQGDFNTLMHASLAFTPEGAAASETVRAASRWSFGFGKEIALDPAGHVDVLNLLRDAPDCGELVLTVSGLTPAQDITIDARLDALVHFRIPFF